MYIGWGEIRKRIFNKIVLEKIHKLLYLWEKSIKYFFVPGLVKEISEIVFKFFLYESLMDLICKYLHE